MFYMENISLYSVLLLVHLFGIILGGSRLMAAMVNKATQGIVQSNLEHIQEGIKRIAEAGRADPLHAVLGRLSVTPQMLFAQGVTQAFLDEHGIVGLELAT